MEFLIVYAQHVPKIERGEYEPCRSARLTVGVVGSLPDPDAYLKDWLDCMKRARLIVDDAQKWCLWERPKILPAPGPFTLITLEEVD